MKRAERNNASDESPASKWMGAAICVLLFIVVATMERGVIDASIGQALSILLMLIGVAWAVKGADKLRRLSELYLWLAFILSMYHLQVLAHGLAGWMGLDGITVFRPVAIVHVLVVLCGLLWSLESLIPIYPRRSGRLWQAAPNVALTLLLILTNLALSFSSASIASYAVKSKTGLLFLLDLPLWAILALSIAELDLFAYIAHVLLHKSWLGWQFHRVHHSENEVDVTTAFRQHPGETVWRILWQMAAIVVFGIPLWMVVIYLTISSLNAQFEHANVRMNQRLDRLLRLIVVTPDMHKAHHSRRQSETDSNYSNIFSLWDRLFGTYTSRINFQELRYGLDGFDDDDKQTLAELLMMPFLKYKEHEP